MSDERFRRLLESPLDEPREPGDGPRWVIAALVAGAVLGGLVAFVATSDGDDAAVTTTGPSVTGSVTTVVAGPSLPDGYTAISEDVGLRAEWMTVAQDRLLVAVSTATASGVDRATVNVFPGGLWTAAVSADTVEFTQEHFDPLALGVLTVEFPGHDVDPGDVTSLRVIPASSRDSDTITTEVVIDRLPWVAGPGQFSFPLEEGVDLVVDAMALHLQGGLLAWHVESDDVVRATVVPRIVLLAGGVDTGAVLGPEHLQDLKSVRRNPAPPSFAAQRTEQISRSDRPVIRDEPLDPEAITELQIEWTIAWQRYESEPITVPMSGVTTRR